MNLLARLRNLWALSKMVPEQETIKIAGGGAKEMVVLKAVEKPKPEPAIIIGAVKENPLDAKL